MTHNPHKPGDRVAVKRGDGWLAGTVTGTKLATVFVELDDSGRITQENYHQVEQENQQ